MKGNIETMKYQIKYEQRKKAFTLFHKDYDNLFVAGDGDITVMKYQCREDSYSEEWSFDYGNNSNVFLGKEGAQTFIPKHICVYQMKERDEIIQQKELIRKTCIQQIEQWTHLEMKSVLFQCENEDWGMKCDEFRDELKWKENIVILFEDYNGMIFGVVINEKIDRFAMKKNERICGKSIKDSNAFVFQFWWNDNEKKVDGRKYKIHENDNYCALTVIDGDYDVVFAIGKNDFLILRRKNLKCWHCSCSFDLKIEEKERVVSELQRIELWKLV